MVSEGFKGGTRGSPIMPIDAVSRTANVERNGGQKWVKITKSHVRPGQTCSDGASREGPSSVSRHCDERVTSSRDEEVLY